MCEVIGAYKFCKGTLVRVAWPVTTRSTLYLSLSNRCQQRLESGVIREWLGGPEEPFPFRTRFLL